MIFELLYFPRQFELLLNPTNRLEGVHLFFPTAVSSPIPMLILFRIRVSSCRTRYFTITVLYGMMYGTAVFRDIDPGRQIDRCLSQSYYLFIQTKVQQYKSSVSSSSVSPILFV